MSQFWTEQFGKKNEKSPLGTTDRELLLAKMSGKIKGLTDAEQKYITTIVIEQASAGSPGVPVVGKVPVSDRIGKIKGFGPGECICPVCPTEPIVKGPVAQLQPMVSPTLAGEFKSAFSQNYEVGYISLIGMFVAIGLALYGVIKYLSADYYSADVIPYIMQNVVVISLITIGLEMHKTINKSLKFGGVNWKPIVVGAGAFGVSVIVQTTIRLLVKVSVSEIDYYLLYVSLAIAEEYCFRLGLLAGIEAIIREKYNNEWVGAGVAIGLSALIFTVYHIFVYSTLSALLSVLGMGIIFGFAFRILKDHKNLDASIIAHLFTNLIAAWSVFAGGG